MHAPPLDRRTFLRTWIAAALAAGATGAPGATAAFAQAALDDAQADELATHLASDPLLLQVLDVLGTVCFADAMGGIALQDDSFVQRMVQSLRGQLGLSGAGSHGHGDAHAHPFPLANLLLAAALNLVRATAFGEETRRETVHELETTVVGVALLMGLTSVARGIVSSEMTAMQMAESDERSIAVDPEEAIADSIVQLTLLSAATQIPLSSFGNASIGNDEFRQVRLAFTGLYGGFLPEREDLGRQALAAHVRERLQASDNPVVSRRVEALLADPAIQDHRGLAAGLQRAATEHTHDLMTILMATSCDDTQAAAGDPGPLVGLYQTYGVDFLQAVPSLVPYTVLVGVERAKFAAHRAGIQRPLFTEERRRYMKKFLKETWANLIVYFATVAPEVTAKVAGTRRTRGTRSQAADGVGVNFSLLEQVLADIEAFLTAAMDPFLSDTMLDTRKTREAVADLQEAVRKFHEAVGRRAVQRLFAPRADGPAQEVSISRAEVFEHQDRIVGEKASGKAPYAYKKDEAVRNLKDLQIRLASIVDEAGIDRFVAELDDIRDNVGPRLEREIREELARRRETPTLMVALRVLQRNPRVAQLLDIGYWHGRIGPALTDTMFVVLLQGLHLPFLLGTSERAMYRADWFTAMPLVAREVISVLYNNVIGLFADNWADCVAHANWLARMYLSELSTQMETLAADYPEVAEAMRTGHFSDDPTRLVPERFTTRMEQTAALLGAVQRAHPGDAARLEAALQQQLETATDYYFKSMLMAMTISVVGAGKSLPGDSTHFTFAAGEKDFTLAVTLKDFQRHPLYHVWELIFSGAYAMVAGPWIAQNLVAPGFARLGLGSGLLRSAQSMMQASFRESYPGLAEQFARLDAVQKPRDASRPC